MEVDSVDRGGRRNRSLLLDVHGLGGHYLRPIFSIFMELGGLSIVSCDCAFGPWLRAGGDWQRASLCRFFRLMAPNAVREGQNCVDSGALRLFAAPLSSSPRQPCQAAQHSRPGNAACSVSDLNRMRQHAETAEDSYPVVLRFIGYSASRHQRQLQAESIGHIGGDAGQAMKKRERTENRARQLASNGEACCQQRRNK